MRNAKLKTASCLSVLMSIALALLTWASTATATRPTRPAPAPLDKMSTTMTAAMEAQLGEDLAGDIARAYNPPIKEDQESSQ